MKIALIHPLLDFNGGAEKQALYLAKELKNRGEEVDIYSISFNREKCYPEINKDLNIHSLMKDFSYPSVKSNILLPYEFLLKIYYAKKLGKKINKKYDVINCHNFPSAITAVELKEQSNTPVVWFCNEPLDIVKSNNPLFWPIKDFDKKIVKKINEIAAFPYNLELIEKLYGRTAKPVYSGLNVNKFVNGNGSRIKEKYDISGNILLFVGQLIEHKRVQDLLYSLELVKKDIPDVKLIIVGEGRYKATLVELSKKLNLEDNVVFTGFVDEAELPDYHASADLFLNPSIKQTWGLVCFEALAAKAPVIVSSDTGAAKVIQENKIGWVLDPLQPEVWAKKIVEILENRGERIKMAEKGHKWVKENMSWETYAKNMLGIFESVVSP